MAFILGLPVVGTVAPAFTPVQVRPAALVSPFSGDDPPEDDAPTGARPTPEAQYGGTAATFPVDIWWAGGSSA